MSQRYKKIWKRHQFSYEKCKELQKKEGDLALEDSLTLLNNN